LFCCMSALQCHHPRSQQQEAAAVAAGTSRHLRTMS
jgi:hypothetical protein